MEGDAPSSPQLRNLGLADPKNNFAEHVSRGEPLVHPCSVGERVDSRDRYLELAPKYWRATRARLDPRELERELGHITVPPPAAKEQPSSN